MRHAAPALLLLLTPLPAAAASGEPKRPDAEQAVRALQNPLAQEMAAGAIDQLVGIVLDTRVGPAAALLDPRAGVRPTDTLRDMRRRDDPAFERRLHDQTRQAVGTAAAVAGGAIDQAAELQRTADRLRAALAPLVAAVAAPARGTDAD